MHCSVFNAHFVYRTPASRDPSSCVTHKCSKLWIYEQFLSFTCNILCYELYLSCNAFQTWSTHDCSFYLNLNTRNAQHFSPSHLSIVYVIYFISLNSFLSLSFSEMNYKDFSATLISRFIYFWMDVALLMDWNTNKYTVKCEWLRCN